MRALLCPSPLCLASCSVSGRRAAGQAPGRVALLPGQALGPRSPPWRPLHPFDLASEITYCARGARSHWLPFLFFHLGSPGTLQTHSHARAACPQQRGSRESPCARLSSSPARTSCLPQLTRSGPPFLFYLLRNEDRRWKTERQAAEWGEQLSRPNGASRGRSLASGTPASRPWNPPPRARPSVFG